ncbi:MAG: hypothetical protein DI582_06335, partial [Azospirillum brasilense]
MVAFAQLDREYGFPEGTLDSVWAQESSRGSNRGNSSAGARGHFQFMPATRDEMMRNHGIDPWSNDPEVAARAAAIYLRNETQRFGGDLAKGLAAYNAGGGNVQRAVRNGGANWLASLPAETRSYVPSIMQRMGMSTDDMDASLAYQQRRDAGGTSREEDETEAQRRRRMLGQAGFDASQMGQGDLLSQMFFALISMAVEKALENMGPAQTASAESAAPTTVPTGTT